MMKTFPALLVLILVGIALPCAANRGDRSFNKPLNGHLILVIAKSDNPEPRNQLSETYDSAQGFGVDAENLQPGTPLVIDAKTFGYPRRSLADLDRGRLLRAGRLQRVRAVPSRLRKNRLAPARQRRRPALESEARQSLQQAAEDPLRSESRQPRIKLTLDQIIPPIEGTPQDPTGDRATAADRKDGSSTSDSAAQSSAPSGVAICTLGAWVLLPDGFDDHPDAKYPVIVYQDHYHAGIGPAHFTAVAPTDSKSP